MKKVYVNGKFYAQRITGTQRYARELLNQFDRLLSDESGPKIAFEVLVPPNAYSVPQYSSLKIRTVGEMNGTQWEQMELPQHCRGEILFTPCGGAPVLHSRNVVTIHDAAVAAVPSGYSFAYRFWYRNLCRRMARKAERIITVSNFSKSEIVKWYGATPENISVTYLGSDHFSNLEADSSAMTRFGISGKYVLAASSRNPNKNFRRIVQAMKEHDTAGAKLVIAGGDDNRIYREGTHLPDGIRALGYVSDAELKALYENASCFVFASLYEGFGLPPLEALSCGCPIVVSRVGSLPEIFDEVACFCDPLSPEDIAAAILQTINRPPKSNDSLREFSKRFSWEKCALETMKLLDAL